MVHLDDFEIICPLNFNNNNSSTTVNSYKAKRKLSEEFVIVHSIDCAKITDSADKQQLIAALKERKQAQTDHPNILKILNIFEDEPFKIIYVISEHCEHGSLSHVIESCRKENKRLSEELICRILYQILCTIKTAETFKCQLNLDGIFLDEEFNIKLVNFEANPKTTTGSLRSTTKDTNKMYQVGRFVCCLCSLTPQSATKSHGNHEQIKKLQLFYSPNFLNLLDTMLNDHCLLNKNIDKILCNSTLLLKSSQWKKTKSFFTVTTEVVPQPQLAGLTSDCNPDLSEAYLVKLRNLREKEIHLKAKEEKLLEKERALIVREKKIAIMERLVQEKMTRAELYLKRNRKIKNTDWNLCKDDDASVSAYCDDSMMKATGTRIDENVVMKPAAFVRSKSERRVKFKGHSPLKDFNYTSFRKSTRRPSSMFVQPAAVPLPNKDEEKENISSSSQSVDRANGKSNKSAKKLFAETAAHQQDQLQKKLECNTIPKNWTEESKKQAFTLLRIMQQSNNGNFNVKSSNEVKHTYL